jgi:uncharacterized membrane protein
MEREQERSTRARATRSRRNEQSGGATPSEAGDDSPGSPVPGETPGSDVTLLHRRIVPGQGSDPRPETENAPVVGDAAPPAAAEPPQPPASPQPERSTVADPNSTTFQDLTPPPPPAWQGDPAGQPVGGAQRPEQPMPTHVPWQAAQSWGPTTLSINANPAAGASYLLLFITGLLIYFNERNNRYVRFHAMQSILLTGVIAVFGVVASILSALCTDVAARTHLQVFQVLGIGIAVLAWLVILCVWLGIMIAAWTGHDVHLPLVGAYAERYAAPPIQPPAPPFY